MLGGGRLKLQTYGGYRAQTTKRRRPRYWIVWIKRAQEGMFAHTYNSSTQEAEARARGEFKANKTTVRPAGHFHSGIISECSNFLRYENTQTERL